MYDDTLNGYSLKIDLSKNVLVSYRRNYASGHNYNLFLTMKKLNRINLIN